MQKNIQDGGEASCWGMLVEVALETYPATFTYTFHAHLHSTATPSPLKSICKRILFSSNTKGDVATMMLCAPLNTKKVGSSLLPMSLHQPCLPHKKIHRNLASCLAPDIPKLGNGNDNRNNNGNNKHHQYTTLTH